MKNRYLLFFMVLFLVGCEAGEKNLSTYNAFIRQADSLYMAGNYVDAGLSFDEAFKYKRCIQGQHLYNSACVAAINGDLDKAFGRLKQRMKRDKNWYVDDPLSDNDLKRLHADSRWAEYVSQMNERKERIERNYDKPLRAQLKQIGHADQDIRYAYINALMGGDANAADSLLRRMQYVDSVNQAQICSILESRGWVGRDVVGDACAVFWLVIQHSSLESQRKYLPLFQKAVTRGELDASSVAMMEDRIAVFEGRPQKYGSQVQQDENGEYVPFELLDADKVDMWRSEVGMPTMEEYLKSMNSSR